MDVKDRRERRTEASEAQRQRAHAHPRNVVYIPSESRRRYRRVEDEWDWYSESFDSEPCFTQKAVYALTNCGDELLPAALSKIDLRAFLPSVFLLEGDKFDPEVVAQIYKHADDRNVSIVTPMAVCACMTKGDVRMLKELVKRGVAENGGNKEEFVNGVMQVIESDVSFVQDKSILDGFLPEGFVLAMPGMAKMLLGIAISE